MAIKKPYREGTWFVVPLREGGYAIGRVARVSPNSGVLFGYFFGPRRADIPDIGEVTWLKADQALLAIQFGDLHLINGQWQIIGESNHWQREQWPIPTFIRRDEISRRAWAVKYADDDPNSVPVETPIDYENTSLPMDTLSGAGAVEIKLTMLLRDQRAVASSLDRK